MSDSTTSAPERARLACLALCMLLLAACGTQEVYVEGEFPRPVMNELPLTLGVYYDEEFRTHEFFDEAKGRGQSDWLVNTGQAQLQMWGSVLEGMFETVIPLEQRPEPGAMNRVTDAVLVPHVDELQYAIPSQTNIKVYEIWLRYRFELLTHQGEPIADWKMTAYGKTPTAFLQSDKEAVRLAAIVALRDAGAHFVTTFGKVPEVRAWLADNLTDEESP